MQKQKEELERLQELEKELKREGGDNMTIKDLLKEQQIL